ncbi:MAG: hypothetical protein NTX04_02590 [Verrucomicrobia bacterium]|nr:hypothetical protein [Verrucomicrobiota bacterium]
MVECRKVATAVMGTAKPAARALRAAMPVGWMTPTRGAPRPGRVTWGRMSLMGMEAALRSEAKERGSLVAGEPWDLSWRE